MTPPVVVTIAGSDSGGGAGIQADLKTFAALRVYGASVITAVTAQNTRAVRGVFALPAAVVAEQLDAVLDDLRVAAVKVGMLGAVDIADAVAVRARDGRLPNLVLDPVLTSSSGGRLGVVAAIERLLPYAAVVTPNVAEASELLGWSVRTPADLAVAAEQLAAGGPATVVVTGGDLAECDDESIDAVCTGGAVRLLRHRRVDTRNTHGTGCTLASAIAAGLAGGVDVMDAVDAARRYVAGALHGARNWHVGAGTGPIDHFGWST